MRIMKKSFTVLLLTISFVFFINCKENSLKGTKVTSTMPEFKELAKKINTNLDCQRIDCCFMDGIETSCAIVNACLEAGFCEVVARE